MFVAENLYMAITHTTNTSMDQKRNWLRQQGNIKAYCRNPNFGRSLCLMKKVVSGMVQVILDGYNYNLTIY